MHVKKLYEHCTRIDLSVQSVKKKGYAMSVVHKKGEGKQTRDQITRKSLPNLPMKVA